MSRHAEISYMKSILRILGYWAAGYASHVLWVTMAVLIIAEIVGIVEEFGQ